MLVNLRGVKESGTMFAIPTYFFILMMFITVVVGLVRYFMGSLGQVVDPPALEMILASQGISLLLILRAFSSGTTALTGVEAISDGILAFKEPRSRNAGATLMMMALILGTLLLGISFLVGQIHAIPSEAETVISQMARTAFDGRGIAYLLTISGTTVILIMAANTSLADFPRLSAITAGDGFLPRQLTYRGSRLVYMSRHRVILPIGGVHRGTLAALRYARSLSDDVTAVHISIDPEETARIHAKWEIWGEGIRLVILDSPYRLLIEPLLQYIEELDEQSKANEVITIVVPMFVPSHVWNNALHTRTAEMLRNVLMSKKNIVITEVPYQVD